MNKEIEIPEGYEARIEGNKVILERRESDDERIRKWLIEQMEAFHNQAEKFGDKEDIEMTTKAITYLERQKEQKPAERSEEDKEMLRIISNRLEKFNEWATEQGYPIDDPTMKQSPIDWLKSLRPQPHWKPSEEQMEALSDAYVEARTFKMADILESLHQDLEKL